MNFSIVIPVKGEQYLKENLPSWCLLNAEEILLCYDKPVSKVCVRIVEAIAKENGANIRILVVEKNDEYCFNQAWVRRRGFLEAKNNTILTGDIDLQVYQSCLKAVSRVGKDNIGLVSLMKIRSPKGFQGKLRGLIDGHIRRYVTRIHDIIAVHWWNNPNERIKPYFTGLYCMYRPYWLDTEDEGIKQLENPKTAIALDDYWGSYCGEDTYLMKCMVKKHRVIFLADYGAKDLGVGLEETAPIQPKIGRKFFLEASRPFWVVKDSIFYVRPHVLGSYMHHLTTVYGLKAYILTMADIIYPWLLSLALLPFRIGLQLILYLLRRQRKRSGIMKRYYKLMKECNISPRLENGLRYDLQRRLEK